MFQFMVWNSNIQSKSHKRVQREFLIEIVIWIINTFKCFLRTMAQQIMKKKCIQNLMHYLSEIIVFLHRNNLQQ